MCWRTARPFAPDVDKQQSDSVLCHFRFGADAAVNSEASSRSVGEHNVGICNGGVSVLRAMTSVRSCASTPQRHRGQPAGLATCPADAECDTDSDGVCDGSDSCRGDADNVRVRVDEL